MSKEEGIEYANEIGAIFSETSAKTNRNGIQLFINELIEEFLCKNNLIKISKEKIFLKKAEKIKNKFHNLFKYFSL